MPSKLKIIHFDRCSSLGGTIDEKKGIVYGVTVITSGVEAKGHSLHSDPITLLQMLESAEKKGGKIPTKIDHKTGLSATNGYIFNFRIEGDKLKGDWKLLEKHAGYSHTLDLCKNMSDIMGLSASFTGEGEVTPMGKAARCTDLLSIDAVSHPACNPDGLFEAKEVDSASEVMANKTTEQMLEEILKNQNSFSERLEKIEEFNTEVAERIEAEGEEQIYQDAEGNEYTQSEVDAMEAEAAEGAGEVVEGEDGQDNPQLAALQARINNLEALNFEAADQAEQNQFAEAMGVLQDKITLLAAQRDEALQRLEAYENPGTHFNSGEGRNRRLATPGQGLTEFQTLVQQHIADATTGTEKQKFIAAQQFCVQNHPEAYEVHLAALDRGEVTNLG